ncbi:MAG: ABC transporter permease [Clostridiales bacterium]|jgi:spermidine/putrescine transport system permease protein|nr:ABC transporter permease [Clostridia bacterium]NLD03507.1 ABC transporter permease [Clostridiales bacterium]
MKILKRAYLAIILLFLYVPIAVLIFQSFNAGVSRAKWEGFSLRWYAQLFQSPNIMEALYVTISIALLASMFSTVLGTMAAIGIHAMSKRPQGLMMTMTNIPMTMPDIVTGISLMLLFIFTKVERGYVTMLLAHITFNTPYVVLSVLPKLKEMNSFSYEAALDLGATPGYALRKVILPAIRPGVITGAILAFTLSLDDFTISYFTTSPLVQNLSTLIYSEARKGIKPTMNALSALMFVALLILLLVVNRRTAESK